jgi:gliding motility-associated-like protein
LYSTPKQCTPDYFNTCFVGSGFQVPHPWYVKKIYPAKEGQGYIGVERSAGCYDSYKTKLLKNYLNNLYIKYYVNTFIADSLLNIIKDNCSQADVAITETNIEFSNDYFYTIETDFKKYILPNNKKRIIYEADGWVKTSYKYKPVGEDLFLYIGTLTKDILITSTFYKAYQLIDNLGVYEFIPLPDTAYLCNGSVQLNARFLDGTYKWSTGETDSLITVNQEEKYSVDVTMDSTLVFSDSVYILNIDKLDVIKKLDVCAETLNKQLSSPIKGNKYSWSTGDTARSIEISTLGSYNVQVFTQCGIKNFLFDIIPRECRCEIKIPNAFTPNGDGTNDALKAINICDYPFQYFSLKIYNRLGHQIYYSNNINEGWTGSNAEVGTYYYLLQYETIIDGKRKLNKVANSFELMR